MNWLPRPETRDAVLKHPFFLAGLAVVGLLGLTAGALVIATSVRGTNASVPTVVVGPVETATPGAARKTAAASGVSATTKVTTSVRQAPGARTVLGTLPAKSDVDIDGRTTDAKWLRIIFPPNSDLHGWIDAANLDVLGDPRALVVATAEPPVIVEIPTDPPSVRTAAAITPAPVTTGTPDPNSTGTAASGKLPDLVIGTTPSLSGSKLFVTVVNQGQGDMHGNLVVAIFNADATKLLGGATLPNFTLAAGRSIDVGTGYVVTQNQTLVLVVDPNGDIDETDNTNNRITVSIAVGASTPAPGDLATPTPNEAGTNATVIALATRTAESNFNATLIAVATQTAESNNNATIIALATQTAAASGQ